MFGLCIGVALLLVCWDVLSFSVFWKLLIPALVVALGLRIIFRNVFKKKQTNISTAPRTKGGNMQFVLFSAADLDYSGQVFRGANYTAIFGGINVDLTNATIENDIVIRATAVFGGIDISLPDGVNVKVSSSSFFGGVDNEKKVKHINDAPTVYIEATSVFGGVDIM